MNKTELNFYPISYWEKKFETGFDNKIGVYVFKNIINDKKYVGISNRLKGRIKDHINLYSKNTPYFHAALCKYSTINFHLAIISLKDYSMTKEWNDTYLINFSKLLEKGFICSYDTTNKDKGYNLTEGGDGTFGYRHTRKARQKMSQASTGREISLETRKKMSESHTGKKLSQETKKKLSIKNSGKNHHMYGKTMPDNMKTKISNALKGRTSPNKGKKASEESKAKMSKAQSGKNNGMWGKTHSPEAREKIRASKIGKPLSPEARKKMSESRKGKKRKPHSEETKAKISKAVSGENSGMWGKTHSPEAREKIRASKIGKNNPMYGIYGKNAPFYGKQHTEESKRKISETKRKNKLKKQIEQYEDWFTITD